MAHRIQRPSSSRRAGILGATFLSAFLLFAGGAFAQASSTTDESLPMPFSKSCQRGSAALAAGSPLPNVAAALKQRKTLRILTMGAAPGRVSPRGDYSDLIESILQSALKGIDVTVIDRGVSGELAADAAVRMKNEVALDEPDLVLWQVGTNDALAYVPVAGFTAAVKDQIKWLRAHKVDVVLVGLQFAPEMLRDAHYKAIRDALRRVAAKQNVLVIRFYEAMEMLKKAEEVGHPVAWQFEGSEEGYDCLAQYVARSITLGIFAKNIPRRPAAK